MQNNDSSDKTSNKNIMKDFEPSLTDNKKLFSSNNVTVNENGDKPLQKGLDGKLQNIYSTDVGQCPSLMTGSNLNSSNDQLHYFKVKEWLQQFSYDQRSIVPKVLPPLKNLFVSNQILRAQKWHRIELMNINEILNATRDIALKFYALPISVDQIKKSFQTGYIVFPNSVFSTTFTRVENLLPTHTQYLFVLRREEDIKTHTFKIYGIARIEGVTKESSETHLSVTYFSLSSIGECYVNFSQNDVGTFSLDLPVAYSLVQKFKLSLECVKSKPMFGIYFPWCGTPPLIDALGDMDSEETKFRKIKNSSTEEDNVSKDSIMDVQSIAEKNQGVSLAISFEKGNHKYIRSGGIPKASIFNKIGEIDKKEDAFKEEVKHQICLDEKPALSCNEGAKKSKVIGFYDSTGNWYPDIDSAITTFEARIKMMTETLEKKAVKDDVEKDGDLNDPNVSHDLKDSFEKLELPENAVQKEKDDGEISRKDKHGVQLVEEEDVD